MSEDNSEVFETDLVISSLSPRAKQRPAALSYSFDGLQRSINLEDDDRLLEGILVLGAFPWDKDQSPRILASFPEPEPSSETLLQFCFPKKTAAAEPVKVTDLSELMPLVTSRPSPRDLEFFALYFANSDQCPYYYCCRFKASPFSVPVICHELNLEQVFQHASGKLVQETALVLVVRARFPYQELYFQMLRWLIDVDKMGRAELPNFIDKLDYFKGNFKKAEDDVKRNPTEKIDQMPRWPVEVREHMLGVIHRLLGERLTEGHHSVRWDIENFPEFVWERAPSERNDLPLGWFALASLMENMSPDVYLQVVEALILERKVIVYSKRNSRAAHAVLALKYMRYPLPQSIPVVSLVPAGSESILENQDPMIVGTEKVPEARGANFVVLDVDAQTIEASEPLLDIPNRTALREAVVRAIAVYATDKTAGARQLLGVTNRAINELTYPIKYAFHVVDDASHAVIFDKDVYRACFTPDASEFLTRLMQTKSFEDYVEELKGEFDSVGLPYPLMLLPQI